MKLTNISKDTAQAALINLNSFGEANTGVLYIGATAEKAEIATADNEELVYCGLDKAGKYALNISASDGGDVSKAGEGLYDEGEKISISALPGEGYEFVKWTSSNGGTFADAFSANTIFTMPASDTNVMAVFAKGGGLETGGSEETEVLFYTLTFEVEGGSQIASVRRRANTIIDLMKYMPSKAGFTFTGWYDSKSLTNKITSILLNKNITVYAGWERERVPVTSIFADVTPGQWYESAVQYVYDHGMMYGVSDREFAPDMAMSRGMVVTVLHRLAGEPKAAPSSFTDVEDGAYYAGAVAWAAENEIVDGYGGNLFGPEDPITREQLAVILYRYSGCPAAAGGVESFRDREEISAWAADALCWAVRQGLMVGKGGERLDPQGKATRAEVATLLMRFCEGRAAEKA